MAEIPVTDTPVTRSLVSGTCVLITVWSAFICYRVQVATQDKGTGAAYWAQRGPMTLEEKTREVEANTHMPPAVKRMVIEQFRQHMSGISRPTP